MYDPGRWENIDNNLRDLLVEKGPIRESKNLGTKLKSHETSNEHIMNMSTWFDLGLRLSKDRTINREVQQRISKEKKHWRNILVKIIAIMKSLNTFDVFKMVKHNIRNELIQMLALAVKNATLKKIKEAKYFSIMLDCTPDVSHQEQMSLIIRCVDVSTNPVRIEEYFLGFLNVDDTSGAGLFSELIEEIKKLKFDINNVRGQGYDNGSNMKGKHQGVQKRSLEINPRALYIPCGCHSLNLIIFYVATSCVRAILFFGILQCIYSLFTSSPKRWKILKNNISSLTVKPLSQTRSESHIESVKAIRFQAPNIIDALLELSETSDDPKIKSEAKCLATYELEDFEFLLGMTIWYDILFAINSISKIFQSKDMYIDVAIDQLKEKKKFDENVGDDTIQFVEESFKIDYFIYTVDQVICSLKSRFEQFEQYKKIFGFLFNFKKLKSLDEDVLKKYCLNLEEFLKYDEISDVNGLYLFSELKVLREIFQKENNSPIEQLHFIKKVDSFPNTYIAY
ncbi:hypothetical protein UlMin_028999 [Ulmus minor]